jgi:hypothetical protein
VLTKPEGRAMLWIAVQSKLISEIAYDGRLGVLHVRLRNGEEVTHEDVAPQMVDNLLTAESPGFYYSFYIAKPHERREHQSGIARLSAIGSRVGKSAIDRIDLPLLQQRIQRMRVKLQKIARSRLKRMKQHDLPKIVARMQAAPAKPIKGIADKAASLGSKNAAAGHGVVAKH